MATILFAWELGAGMGHVMQMAPLANVLAARGHRVVAALRELRNAQGIFGPAVALAAAPFRSGPGAPARVTRNFADVLQDVTFENQAMLASHVGAWRQLFDWVKPDLIVFDHAPTALLAARGRAVRRLVIGVGYCVPPDLCPFPQLTGGPPIPRDELVAAEEQVLARANGVLDSFRQPRLARLGQLYSEVDGTFLMTFPELDPYTRHRRPDSRFWGAVTASGGAEPCWPGGEGKKIYCYLRKFAALHELLKFLRESGLPTLVFGDIDGPTRTEFGSATLAFAAERPDPAIVNRECELAVINSGHGAVASVLLAGKPSLQLPLYQEQGLNARAVRRMGAGLDASTKDGPGIVQKLKELLENDKCAEGAKRFARRHRWFDPRRQREEMLDRVERILGRGIGGAAPALSGLSSTGARVARDSLDNPAALTKYDESATGA